MFYHFSQNNSNGWFKIDHERGIDKHVIIEAKDSIEVNHRAERIGLYFYMRRGDCSQCCGNRWREASGFGSEVPHVYGEEVMFVENTEKANGFVHFANGDVKPFFDK